jgi:hypothetical protein
LSLTFDVILRCVVLSKELKLNQFPLKQSKYYLESSENIDVTNENNPNNLIVSIKNLSLSFTMGDCTPHVSKYGMLNLKVQAENKMAELTFKWLFLG